jgi:hypothetical protein
MEGPGCVALLRAGLKAAARNEGDDLSREEAEHYYETGELPERITRTGELWAERWPESRG